MKIVIIGAGNVGKYITKSLANEGHDIIVIDREFDTINEVVNEYNVRGICGNGALSEIQQEAGVDSADIVISATSYDEMNIVCSLVAKSLGAGTIVARLRKIEYSKQFEFMRDNLGVDLLINPEKEMARSIAQLLQFPYAVDYIPFAGGKLNGLTIEVPEDCNLVGLHIGDIEGELDVNAVIYAVQKGEELIIPDEEYIIEQGDKLSIVAKPDTMRGFIKKIGLVNRRIKTALVMGGDRIAYYLAQFLAENKIAVKVVEKSKSVCDEVASSNSNASIVLATDSYYNILHEEGLDNIDSFICLTDDDEENIVLSLYAKNAGVENVVTRIEDDSLIDISRGVDLNKCISTKTETALEIIKFARNLYSEKQDNNPLVSFSKILTERGEVIEFEVDDNENIINIPLKQMKLRKDVLIACILRGKEVIIPHSTDVLQTGDKIIVVTKHSQLASLENILR